MAQLEINKPTRPCTIYFFFDLKIVLYLQGYYDSMDEGIMDTNGCISIMTRGDDVINVAGHRLSTKAIEEVIKRK